MSALVEASVVVLRHGTAGRTNERSGEGCGALSERAGPGKRLRGVFRGV